MKHSIRNSVFLKMLMSLRSRRLTEKPLLSTILIKEVIPKSSRSSARPMIVSPTQRKERHTTNTGKKASRVAEAVVANPLKMFSLCFLEAVEGEDADRRGRNRVKILCTRSKCPSRICTMAKLCALLSIETSCANHAMAVEENLVLLRRPAATAGA